jgi:hypothetical protein
MSMKEIGVVHTTQLSRGYGKGEEYTVFWDSVTHELKVAGETVGTAPNEETAMMRARRYAADPINYSE